MQGLNKLYTCTDLSTSYWQYESTTNNILESSQHFKRHKLQHIKINSLAISKSLNFFHFLSLPSMKTTLYNHIGQTGTLWAFVLVKNGELGFHTA